MTPRTTFPGSGPDQTLFMVLLGIGFVVALLGYLAGSRTLRMVGIMIAFAATGIFVVDVFRAGG